MTTTHTIADEKGSINPIENPSGWIDNYLERERDAEPEAPAGQPAAEASAEPASTPTTPQATVEPAADPLAGEWWETGLPANHGFLRGRKGDQVEEAFRNGERMWKRTQEENARLKRELEDARRRPAEPPPQAPPVAPVQQQPQEPTDEEIDQLWLENPSEARRLTVEKAKREALDAVRAERQAEVQAEEQRQAGEASQTVMTYLMTERGYDEAAAKRAVISTFPHLRQLRQEGSAPDAFTNPRVILWMVDQILAPAMTAATAPPTSAQPAAPAEEQPPVPPTPTVPNPPGSKRPASLQARTPTESPLRAEQEEVRRSLAAEFGVDPQRLIDRAKARGGRRGR
jgi:hypothetical protein